MERLELAIIIPAFNEQNTIGHVVERTRALGQVIVVNDASQDATSRQAEQFGAIVVNHSSNRGYDAALNSGFKKAFAMGCRYVITLDADGQHEPSLVSQFAFELERNALVLGVRPKPQRVAEWVFAFVTHLLYGIRDPLCGMKGYRMELFRALGHFDAYGSIGTELALTAVRSGISFSQIAIPIREREDQPRFGRRFAANYRIFRALVLGFILAKRPMGLELQILKTWERRGL